MILHGDSLNKMSELEDNSVDAIVTDPPYGLSFMGKKWDYDVPSVDLWKECLRVLKPGAFLLSFAGTRTYHRMAVNIEDAGFEIRDMISWLYGSGFPKSLNIGKSIDKMAGAKREVIGTKGLHGYKTTRTPLEGMSGLRNDFNKANQLTAPATPEAKEWEGWGTSIKPSNEPIVVATKPLNTLNHIDILCRLIEYVKDVERNLKLKVVGLNEGKETIVQENVPIHQEGEKENLMETGKVEALKEVMDTLQFSLKEVNTNLNTILLWKNLLEEIYNEMNKSTISMESEMTTELKILNSLLYPNIQNFIILEKSKVNGNQSNVQLVENLLKSMLLKLRSINIISVQENVIRKELELYPNNSPICMARKSLSEKNVALNVLKWGTGGINIDACRVGASKEDMGDWNRFKGFQNSNTIRKNMVDNKTEDFKERVDNGINIQGRFPANIILDEEAGKILDEQSGNIKSGSVNGIYGHKEGFASGSIQQNVKASQGGASRFFYCAKASKSERNMGCEELEEKEQKITNQYEMPRKDGSIREIPAPRKNSHPTVKPIKLMEYLVKLVSRENAKVLDPFMGSGTTGIACKKLKRQFIGIEREEDYIKIARERIKATTQSVQKVQEESK
jgi:DNA modification methylase